MSGFSRVQLTPAVALGVTRGEPAALAEAYRLLAQSVMNLATRMLNDPNLAEEVLQDTFIELVEKSTQIRDSEAVAGWVKRVAVNHCLMKLRAPWHTRRSSGDVEWLIEAQAEQSTASQANMEWVASVPGLEQALAQLGDDARTVLWLHDVEGYTHKEIGELMGRTSSFSKSQLARAYEKLIRWRTQRENEQLQHSASTARDIPKSSTANPDQTKATNADPGTRNSSSRKAGNKAGNKESGTKESGIKEARRKETDQDHEQAKGQFCGPHCATPCPS